MPTARLWRSSSTAASKCPRPSNGKTQTWSAGSKVSVSVRPEQLVLARDDARLPADAAIRAQARVLNRIFLGEHTEYLLRHEGLGDFLVLSPRQSEANERPLEAGETVYVACSQEAVLVLENS